MESEDEQVNRAFHLWKANLLGTPEFYEILNKLKETIKFPITPQDITQGQINYIKRLINEGKIPKTQTLNLTKSEAQVLIHDSLNKKSDKSDELEDLYKGELL